MQSSWARSPHDWLEWKSRVCIQRSGAGVQPIWKEAHCPPLLGTGVCGIFLPPSLSPHLAGIQRPPRAPRSAVRHSRSSQSQAQQALLAGTKPDGKTVDTTMSPSNCIVSKSRVGISSLDAAMYLFRVSSYWKSWLVCSGSYFQIGF